jgi:glyoxylase-like metal-dependent hydrolase (beta-lactamase superfamily II)
MRPVREGEAMAGISAVALPGHTPGHTGWLIASGNESLLIWGDLVHLASVQVARPDTGLVFDVDPQQACATRRRTFDRVAADKLTVAGAHMDFPASALGGPPALFDHLVGAQKERLRDLQAKHLGGGEVKDQVELSRLLDRNVGWLRPA